ncbi:amino acid adenylation domain-containing protein [Pseudobutyrivibrio sp. ACV-2]|uniref:non-ribosomal peptide synthetase n=1 Tax=Pseudobutyrivibrio sp. ACV-2 TaxID=1520801 RepID=UPI00089C72BF|nr:non-ribosomal peptide synthetase [Pseudobutyrivibrio sp. ACV-2]SEA49967.1 amino acid adenylation domain-containing protein [Pseudobutyrivibrio sp. ACV-2]
MDDLLSRIRMNVKENPDMTIIIDQGENNYFTYKSLDLYARKIATKLVRKGVSRNDFVSIEMMRTKEYVAAMYAVWLVGAAFVPLSSSYPEERRAFIRDNCHAKTVINTSFLKGVESEEIFQNDVVSDPQSPALAIYTSGSTGKPKGVLHSHASIEDSVFRYIASIPSTKGSHTALGAPFTFVASVQGVFTPLVTGTVSYLMPFEAMRDPILLADFIEENQINRTFISPKMLKVFKPKGDSLKMVFTGSERVSDFYTDMFETYVAYGQTESAGAVMFFKIDKSYNNTPIGKPVEGVRIHILDEQGSEADEGELCLAGIFADGYIDLPEQTKNVFIDNPFAKQDGFAKLLKTGDIVKKGEDGNIIYLNRKDWMVKINGQRVEPGEIETIIRQTPGIKDAVLKDFKNQYGQVYLVAYYIENEPVDAADIKEAIGRKLPSYMVPAFFVKLDSFPINANGKLDRNALVEPETGAFKNDYAAPETDMQKALCAAFESVLAVENVGIDDDFFALGGDSIKCALVSEACSKYMIKTADIFAGKTPRMIERLLLQKASGKKHVKKAKKARIYPLTPLERGMYLEQKMHEDSTVYNLNIAAIIKGSDFETVKQSLSEVFKAHEAFTSYYGEEKGLPVRILSDKLPEIVEKSAATREEVIAIIDSYAEPFNLNAEIPVRPTLYGVADGSIILHMAIHHIAFDGGSAKTFVKELIDGIEGRKVTADGIDLSDLYDDSLADKYESGMSFYHELFADGVPVNEMPVKGKRPKVHPLSDREISFDYDNAQLKGIDNIARRFSVTEFELIFSAVSMALGKYTASEDVVLGIPTNMRPEDGDNVIGMFVNTAPVRVKPKRDADISEYLAAVSTAVRNATYGAYLPFEDVVAEFVKQRDESRNPIFDVSVNYMVNPPAYDNNGLSVELYAPLQKMGRDIGIVIRKSEKGLHFMVQYSTELFEDEVIENFVGQIQHTLSLLGGDVKTVRDALSLPDNQRSRLEAFKTEATAEIPITLLHKLFEHSACENADKTALIARDVRLSYQELNDRANIVAHNLIARGIKTGDSVALLLPRESCFFACMLGVNKAGAAFIPCDPQYPADRINYIIEDSGAAFIITTADKLSDYPSEKAIDVKDLMTGDAKNDPDISMSDDELSYIIYTSGSTGKPKGVMLRHKGICNYLMPHPANTHMHYLKENTSVYLSVTTVSFDMSFKEHAAAFCNGKTLVFAAEDEMNDPRALATLMEQYKVDCFNATPSRLQQYLEYEPFRKALSRCKLVMSGGEGYPISLRDAIKKCSSDIRIINTYGPTEITVSCNAADLTDVDYVTVGRPLLNYHEIIVDKFGDIAPYGVIGELYIGGTGVAKGYRNLPEKTAGVFVNYENCLMYRSGDYAKWDNEGKVQILGRLDNQVKLRGLRIELDEIQGLIAMQPHIRKAEVVIRKLNGQDNLCAYFTADTEIDVDELRTELKKHLTHYMVPTAYLQMNEMPMTANGKTDIKKLPDPVPVNLGEYVAPANEMEEFFCQIFGKALHLERVGATDDFFEIGGTSLLVTAVVMYASEKGYEITYGDIFKYTTPRALAELFKDGEINDTNKLFDFDDYDYTKINKLLANNTVEAFKSGQLRDIGNILLTGATGYMGAHLLAEYLKTEKGKAYCLIRKGKFDTAFKRLENIMFYYFGSTYEKELNERVEVMNGDVTDYKYFEPMENLPINTVFNCAANVKHFSNGTDIEDINVGGVTNCVRLCKKNGARLIHFSTISVSGTTEDVTKLSRRELDEQSLYFGQTLDNKYTSSKLMGERVVLEAVAEGLDAKVIRVGTLAARESDGEFQINFLTNNFMGRLRSYSLLGCFPYNMIENQVCMGAIDRSCEAFLKLAKTPGECCVFNAVNNHTLPLGDIIRRMNHNGSHINFVEYDEFAEVLKEAQKNPDKAAILSSMTAYMNTAHGKKISAIPYKCHYTTQILARMGFFWNASSEKYVDDFINVLRGFMFFSSDNLKR